MNEDNKHTIYVIIFGISIILIFAEYHFGNALYVFLVQLIVSFICLFIAYSVFNKRKPEKSVINVISDVIAGKISELYGLSGLIFILVILNIIADYIYTFVSSPINYLPLGYAFIHMINIFSFGYMYLAFYPQSKINLHYTLTPKKVVVMALSMLNGNISERISKLESMILEGRLDNNTEKINWQLPLRVLNFHKSTLQKVYLLVSEKSGKYLDDFKYLAGKLDESLPNKIESYLTNFDNHNDIMQELHKILQRIKTQGFKDDDISVNISGGTSAVTACLVIFALEDKRQIEYFAQESNEHKVLDIKRQDAIVFLKTLSIE